jgi:acetolactate synthase-1/2/3 large subunit
MFASFDANAQRDERPFNRAPSSAARAWPCPQDLEEILGLLLKSEKPMLIGGHGVWWSGAERKLEEVGLALGMPVYNSPYHQKLLSETSEAYMGLADVHQYPPSQMALAESDVVVMIGGRLDNQMNFGNPPLFPTTTQLICVNGSAEELDLNRAADKTLLSDPSAFLDALAQLKVEKRWNLGSAWFDAQRVRRGEWVEETLAAMHKENEGKSGVHPLKLALAVQSAMGSEDWLVIDGGNTHFWSEIAINIAGWGGQQLAGILHPGAFSMLGVGVSFALAAKLNHPAANAVVISGDGAFLSGGLGIEAAFQEKAPIVVVIDNNGGLTTISQQQERLFGHDRHVATDFRDIPFHTMCEGLGGYGELVEDPDEIVPAVRRALNSGLTACVNVRTRGVISPIVAAVTSRRDKASIE